MNYFSVSEIARRWVVSERTVRNWCAVGKIKGAFLTGKTWNIPEDAVRPRRGKEKPHSDNPLLNILKEQKDMQLRGGIYHRVDLQLQPYRGQPAHAGADSSYFRDQYAGRYGSGGQR